MSEWRQWWSGINRTVRACKILSPRYLTEQFERFVSSLLRRGVAFPAVFWLWAAPILTPLPQLLHEISACRACEADSRNLGQQHVLYHAAANSSNIPSDIATGSSHG
jgi:hypothetical protein